MGFIDTFRDEGARLYLITDRALCPDGLAAPVEEALKGGVRLVQLREKDLGGRELLKLARELRAVTDKYGSGLIINDRVDVALSADADGVHLGQGSFSPADARRLMGKGKLIGVSTHGTEEAKRAEDEGADFITFGPVYFTPSKARYGEPVGLEPLREAAGVIGIPVYALGGIKKERVAEAMDAGAYGVAVISAVLGAPGVQQSASGLVTELKKALSRGVERS
jgi:thiamine-phosphate pyrophosphorylase